MAKTSTWTYAAAQPVSHHKAATTQVLSSPPVGAAGQSLLRCAGFIEVMRHAR